MQWHVVNTLFQEMKSHHNQKDGSREAQKLDPCWKLRPVACMVNTELRLEFGLWVKTTLNTGSEFLMDQINLWWIRITLTQQFLKICLKNKRYNWRWTILHADQRQKQNRKEENLPALPQEQFLLRKELGPMLNQGYIHSLAEISKKLMHLLRHGQHVHREDDGAVQFWRIKKLFRNISHIVLIGLIASGRKAWQEEEETRKYISTVLILQEQLCISELFKDIQEAILMTLHHRTMWLIPNNFFEYIYHVGCGINLHCIINSGLIPGGHSLSKRQTVFFHPVDPRDKSHKDLDTIDLNEPRHAQYMHKAWKIHQNAVYWVDINLAIEKGLKFYQIRSNAIILQGTLAAYCISKVVRMDTGEVIYEKVYMSPRLPPKIS